MNSIFKLLLDFHKWLLLISFVGFFVAKVLVGAAGHNSDFHFTDYLFLAYLVGTAILLSIIQYAPKNETLFSKIIRYITIISLVVGVVAGVQILYENFDGYDYSITGMFFLILDVLFIISGSILCFVFIKNKRQMIV